MGPEFFQTGMGRAFFQGTMPGLVRAVERLADAVGPQVEKDPNLIEVHISFIVKQYVLLSSFLQPHMIKVNGNYNNLPGELKPLMEEAMRLKDYLDTYHRQKDDAKKLEEPLR